jgi:hypothetical protein
MSERRTDGRYLGKPFMTVQHLAAAVLRSKPTEPLLSLLSIKKWVRR